MVEIFHDVPSTIEVHPSVYFNSQSFSQGDYLLAEGQLERRVVFIVRDGLIAFCRGAWDKRDSETVSRGGLFSSVAAVPFHAREPLSAMVVSPSAEILVLEGDNFRMLPEMYLDRLRNYLRQLKSLCVRRSAQRDPSWFRDEHALATCSPKF